MSVVQHPNDAAFPDLPENVLRMVHPDHVVSLRDMGSFAGEPVHQPAGKPIAVPEQIRFEVEIAKTGRSNVEEMDRFGRRWVLGLPDCQGLCGREPALSARQYAPP